MELFNQNVFLSIRLYGSINTNENIKPIPMHYPPITVQQTMIYKSQNASNINYLHMVGFVYFLVSKYSTSRLSLPVWCYYDQIMIKNKVFTVQWQSRTQTNLDLRSLLLTHKKALVVSSTRYAKDCIRKRAYPSHSRTSEEGTLLFMHSIM